MRSISRSKVSAFIAMVLMLAPTLALGAKAVGSTSHAKPVMAPVAALLVQSAQSGAWSSPATWIGGHVPPAGSRVQIHAGHHVIYDQNAPTPIRAVFIAGQLSFAPDCDTRLDVGLVKIEASDDISEEGFDCSAHMQAADSNAPMAALEVGTASRPIDAGHTALIRLKYFQGMDPQSCPAIVDCGGRMEFHGAEMNHTWTKLGAAAKKGDTTITLSEPVIGWRRGDHVILTGTVRQIAKERTIRTSVRDNTQTEHRFIRGINGTSLELDGPLEFDHAGDGNYRGEVANLSRNVIVESADPSVARGHTMYHRNSAGSISYAEFRHLGKPGVLGRYSIHFHLCRDTMRGASVVGASIWDSGNRWITIHGTDYLVVRDCVGCASAGHGFFLEDGTEVFNVLDHNLAVQACRARRLPNQVLAFDNNDGAGFWWANSLNTFTGNVAAECDQYAFRFEAPKLANFNPVLEVPQPDGTRRPTDIRTIPFVRFDNNEAHTMRVHSLSIGGFASDFRTDVGDVGPDVRHPFIVRNFKAWDIRWAINPGSPSVMVDGLDVNHVESAVWKANYHHHAYRRMHLEDILWSRDFAPRGTQPKESDFPGDLSPVDDLPPTTVITRVIHRADGSLLVRGTTADNGDVKQVIVNGRQATAVAPNFAEWEIAFEKAAVPATLTAHAEDAAGNVEPRPHVVQVSAAE